MTTEQTELLQKTATSDLQSLNRVSHKLAMTESGQALQRVLAVLLPRLLQRIGSNHALKQSASSNRNSTSGSAASTNTLIATYDQIHAKLVEMMSHIMKRVRHESACQLPCREILGLLYNEKDADADADATPLTSSDKNVNPFTVNLALAFLTLGVPRLSEVGHVEVLVPGLLVLLGGYSTICNNSTNGKFLSTTAAKTAQANQVAHLLLSCIERLVTEGTLVAPKSEQSTTAASTATGEKTPIQQIRQLLQDDSTVAQALFDLLLDSLLYQPHSNSNMPPPGLSQAGHERLRSNATWVKDMSLQKRLCDFKVAMLDFVSPSKRWSVYLPDSSTSTSSDGIADRNNGGDSSSAARNLARTVALLVAASGDSHRDLAERAQQFLKSHFEPTARTDTARILGDAMGLSTTLLSLCVGESNADSAVKKILGDSTTKSEWRTLGRTVVFDSLAPPSQRQLVLSWKRRMVGDKTCSALMKFVATQILDDTPSWAVSEALVLGDLSSLAADRWLLSTGGTSIMSAQRAAPYVAASQLLNSLVVRLTSLLERTNTGADDFTVVADCLAKSLSTVCSVVSGASTPRPAATPGTDEGSLAMRDACYGAICALSRSGVFVSRNEGWVFSCGNVDSNMSAATSPAVSVETASLLFGCASNEQETLRPRAVAALDALLGAYCRLYAKIEDQSVASPSIVPMDGVYGEKVLSNPWGSSPTQEDALTVSDAKRARMSRVGGEGEIANDNEGLARVLSPLLWSASQATQAKASRVAAARWAGDLLKGLDLSGACHLLCFLAGDSDVTAASIARQGLGLSQKVGEGYDTAISLEDGFLPEFGELTTVLFSQSSLESRSARPSFFEFSHNGKAVALRFSLICMFGDLYGGEDGAVTTYMLAIRSTLAAFRDNRMMGRDSVDLLDESAICLAGCLSTSQYARRLVVSEQALLCLADMERLAVGVLSSKARRYLSEACGHVYEDEAQWAGAKSSSVALHEWVEKSGVNRALSMCEDKLSGLQSGQSASGEIHGSAYLGARSVRAFRLIAARHPMSKDATVRQCWEMAGRILALLSQGLLHADEVIGNAVAHSLQIAFSYNDADAPILDEHLHVGTTQALTGLESALRKFGGGDHTDPIRASVLARAAGAALAASTSAAGLVTANECDPRSEGSVGPSRLQCVEALFSLLGSPAFRKDAEVALAAGEALALYTDAYSPRVAMWSSNSTRWPENFDEELSSTLPPHQQVLHILLKREIMVSSPHKRTACAPALLALVGRATKMVNENVAMSSRYLVRELLSHLADIQQAFIVLLADPKSKQFTRESACIGLAACYGLARAASIQSQSDEMIDGDLSGGLNDSLLRAFGQTTNFGGSALMETRGQEAERRQEASREQESGTSLVEPFGIESEQVAVGGTAGLSEASLGAYREMAAASLALQRPDILYTLLMLSVSSPVWFSQGLRDRYSVAAILGESSIVGTRANAAAMRVALRPHLAKLIPRLLRACHDPNKQTREQLGTLWVGLTGGGAEARAAITLHLLTTIDTLIGDASNKFWRARVGACGALAEVIVGRSWNELGGGNSVMDDDEVMVRTKTDHTPAGIRLLRLWRAVVRALDDVRLAVRESGETLARSLKALTIRLCDPSAWEDSEERETSESEQERLVHAKAAAATSLRWLVKFGLNQQCDEATGACVSCLLGVIDVVQPVVLQPVLSDIIGALLMAISGLEPNALNYLQVRAAGRDSSGDSYDRLERIRLQMAQSGPIAAALTKCLDIVPLLNDLQAQKKVIPQLDSSLRGGAGFATRAATADAVSSLCAKCPIAFKFQGSSTGNPTVRLLRALYFASEREHGQAARDKMAHALGNLAAVAPGSSVRSLAVRACERYTAATGSNDDPAARRAAAAALRALAVRASSHLADGGPNDIWCKKVLPLAFLGQKDADSKVAALWKEVWNEGGAVCGSSRGNLSTGDASGTLLEDQLLPYLVTACVEAMNDVSWARREAACTALVELCDLGILSPVPRGLTSSSADAEQSRARHRAEAACLALKSSVSLMMRPRVWKGKASVVKAAVKVAGQWTAAILSEDSRSIFGWDSLRETCPWAPFVIKAEKNEKDLFLGDGWFRSMHESFVETSATTELSPSVVENSMRVSDNDRDDSRIDFAELDRILESEVEQEEEVAMEEDITGHLTLSGLCQALLYQGLPNEGVKISAVSVNYLLPYRASALEGLADLLRTVLVHGGAGSASGVALVKAMLYGRLSPSLIKAISLGDSPSDEVDKSARPPIIVAKSIDCLAASIWEGIGHCESSEATPENVVELLTILRRAGGPKQAAWTVRESSALAAASIVSLCHPAVFQSHQTIDELIDMAKYALTDRKFWRVRVAGLKIIFALVSRARPAAEKSAAWSLRGPGASRAVPSAEESHIVLETLLPQKETVLDLARSSLTDSQANVASKASDIVKEMAWWP